MIITKKDFCNHVETNFATNTMTMIDTMLDACEEFNLDPDMVESLVNRSLKEKMKIEFINLNYLKQESAVIL